MPSSWYVKNIPFYREIELNQVHAKGNEIATASLIDVLQVHLEKEHFYSQI